MAVSHRGTKRYTALALGRAREAGCRTALVTGEGDAGGDAAGIVFRTVAQEKSPAHTVSHTTAVAVLALLAPRTARAGIVPAPESLLFEEVPAALRATLGTEDTASDLGPLQLFSYHLARGTNPDSFRAEDARFARADVSGRL